MAQAVGAGGKVFGFVCLVFKPEHIGEVGSF
jgi:hypothetical protein